MTTSAMDVVVTGVAAVTPRGDTLAEALAADRCAPPDGWFDPRQRLGKRGYKYLPAASQYLLAATRGALEGARDDLASVPPEARGVAVGTNSAASALHAAIDRTVVGSSTDELSPAFAPFFSINLFSSRLATEHQLKGFNLTSTSPRVAALEALETGLRALRLGRAEWLLVGATEEPLDPDEPGAPSSECGAVALVLETAQAAEQRGARVYGHLRARTAFLAPAVAAGSAQRAADLVREGLQALGAGGGPGGALLVVDDSPVGRAVATAVGDGAERVAAGAGCLEPMLRAAGLVACGDRQRVLMTAAAHGNIAVALATPAGARSAPGAAADATVEGRPHATVA
jgi:3-oxoacyl-[acyl-carrier-protein] synthase II